MLISGGSISISEGIALTNGCLKINYSNFTTGYKIVYMRIFSLSLSCFLPFFSYFLYVHFCLATYVVKSNHDGD